MLKIHSSQNATEIHNLANVMKDHGIECEIHGENLSAAVGELPAIECWVELWILDESMQDAARKIIAEGSGPPGEAWTCRKCGESVGGEFSQCWNCQAPAPT